MVTYKINDTDYNYYNKSNDSCRSEMIIKFVIVMVMKIIIKVIVIMHFFNFKTKIYIFENDIKIFKIL